MKEHEIQHNQVIKEIESNHLEEALEILIRLAKNKNKENSFSELIVISSNLKKLRSDTRKGIIIRSDIKIEESKIANSLYEINRHLLNSKDKWYSNPTKEKNIRHEKIGSIGCALIFIGSIFFLVNGSLYLTSGSSQNNLIVFLILLPLGIGFILLGLSSLLIPYSSKGLNKIDTIFQFFFIGIFLIVTGSIIILSPLYSYLRKLGIDIFSNFG